MIIHVLIGFVALLCIDEGILHYLVYFNNYSELSNFVTSKYTKIGANLDNNKWQLSFNKYHSLPFKEFNGVLLLPIQIAAYRGYLKCLRLLLDLYISNFLTRQSHSTTSSISEILGDNIERVDILGILISCFLISTSNSHNECSEIILMSILDYFYIPLIKNNTNTSTSRSTSSNSLINFYSLSSLTSLREILSVEVICGFLMPLMMFKHLNLPLRVFLWHYFDNYLSLNHDSSDSGSICSEYCLLSSYDYVNIESFKFSRFYRHNLGILERYLAERSDFRCVEFNEFYRYLYEINPTNHRCVAELVRFASYYNTSNALTELNKLTPPAIIRDVQSNSRDNFLSLVKVVASLSIFDKQSTSNGHLARDKSRDQRGNGSGSGNFKLLSGRDDQEEEQEKEEEEENKRPSLTLLNQINDESLLKRKSPRELALYSDNSEDDRSDSETGHLTTQETALERLKRQYSNKSGSGSGGSISRGMQILRGSGGKIFTVIPKKFS